MCEIESVKASVGEAGKVEYPAAAAQPSTDLFNLRLLISLNSKAFLLPMDPDPELNPCTKIFSGTLTKSNANFSYIGFIIIICIIYLLH